MSVALEGQTIRPATMADEPHSIVGAVSASPSLTGDAAGLRWSEKYLRDDLGSFVMESHDVAEWTESGAEGEPVMRCHALDALPEGVTVPADARITAQQRRTLNPAFDPAQHYTPRAERPEWAAVGLLGKLRVRKGQPAGDRWIKLRDVSESVEEWLVR